MKINMQAAAQLLYLILYNHKKFHSNIKYKKVIIILMKLNMMLKDGTFSIKF